jgi:S-adenosylmethionine:tRNA-ribosyltransferase-isomerase (queuine synthetase)
MEKINIDYYWNNYYKFTFVDKNIIIQKKTLNMLKLCFNDGISTVLDYIDNSDNLEFNDLKLMMNEIITIRNEYNLTGDVKLNAENGKLVNEQWKKYLEKIYINHNVILDDNAYKILSNAFKSGIYSALYSLLIIGQNSNEVNNFYKEIESIRKQIKNFEIEISADIH